MICMYLNTVQVSTLREKVSSLREKVSTLERAREGTLIMALESAQRKCRELESARDNAISERDSAMDEIRRLNIQVGRDSSCRYCAASGLMGTVSLP